MSPREESVMTVLSLSSADSTDAQLFEQNDSASPSCAVVQGRLGDSEMLSKLSSFGRVKL